MIGYIYLIIDLTNWKKYVGQHHYHLEKLDSNYHGSGHIIRQIYKKRPQTLKEVYLKTCYTQEELDEWEQYYIKFYDTLYPNGYNLTEGGGGCAGCEETRRKISESTSGEKNHFFGKHHSDESKKKISEYRKGKQLSDQTKQKMSESRKGEKNHFFGKHHSDESKKKMSEYRKGKQLSEETKKKLSEATSGEKNPMFGKKHSEESKRKISESKKNISDETRKKMSEAAKRRFMLKKMQPDGCLPLW